MYQILYDIHHFLKKYNIKYCSFAGTLIGLIRNKGLLYWDDDIDIVIHQNDLDKL